MGLKAILEALGFDVVETDEEQLDADELRIVEGEEAVSLTSLDDDDIVMGVPLRLNEACSLDFDKHMDAIVGDEELALEDAKKYTKLDIAQENKREFDRRYKEMPRDRIRFKK